MIFISMIGAYIYISCNVQLSISFCIMRKLYMEEKRNIFCGFRLTCNVETRFTNEKSNVNRIRKKSLSLFIYL